VLLNAFYTTGGIARPLQGAQRRFESPSAEAYWTQMDRLAARCDSPLLTLGVVAHSVRAARSRRSRRSTPKRSDASSGSTCTWRSSGPRSDECLAKHGRRPMELLVDLLPIDGNLTAVHCTHTHPTIWRGFSRRAARSVFAP